MPYQSPIEENWPSYNERFPKHEWTRPDNGFVPKVLHSFYFEYAHGDRELFIIKINEIETFVFDRNGFKYCVKNDPADPSPDPNGADLFVYRIYPDGGELKLDWFSRINEEAKIFINLI